MSSTDIIRCWATLLLAEAPNLNAAGAEKVLFGQPRWSAQLQILEASLRARARTPTQDSRDSATSESRSPVPGSAPQLLETYEILSRALKDIEACGLTLDNTLIERRERDWSPRSTVGYLRTCNTQLKRGIGESLNAAAAALGAAAVVPAIGRGGMPAEGRTGPRARTASKKAPRKTAAAGKPNLSPERPRGPVA